MYLSGSLTLSSFFCTNSFYDVHCMYTWLKLDSRRYFLFRNLSDLKENHRKIFYSSLPVLSNWLILCDLVCVAFGIFNCSRNFPRSNISIKNKIIRKNSTASNQVNNSNIFYVKNQNSNLFIVVVDFFSVAWRYFMIEWRVRLLTVQLIWYLNKLEVYRIFFWQFLFLYISHMIVT